MKNRVDVVMGVAPNLSNTAILYQPVGRIRILRITVGEHFRLSSQIWGVLRRAGFRPGVMARPKRSSWRQKAGLLRSTHVELLASLVSYGLAMIGSASYFEHFRLMSTIDDARVRGMSTIDL